MNRRKTLVAAAASLVLFAFPAHDAAAQTKAITFHVEMATFSNWDGQPRKRALRVKGDTLTYTVTAPSAGGPPNDVVWKRIK